MVVVHGLADSDKSFSHTIQVDATYEIIPRLNVTAAWRWSDVKATYNGSLREKPMNSRYKGLLTASYAPGLGKWQFDATLQLNGGGRLPDNHGNQLWDERFKAYEQVSAQVTRFFRHWSIYAGGENLTGFKQKNAIISARAISMTSAAAMKYRRFRPRPKSIISLSIVYYWYYIQFFPSYQAIHNRLCQHNFALILKSPKGKRK
jgi:hypothetical protein